MTEKTVRRDQENIYLDKHSAPPSHHQRRDIRLFEDRVLQETQQPTYQSNAFYLKSYAQNAQNKDNSTLSNNSANNDKSNGNGNKIPQKGSDNELRQILKESTSPTASVGTHDISYRIVNEILNTQEGDRNQIKAKMNSRMVDRKKSPLVTAQTSAIDNLVETPKEGKPMFVENEQLRRLENEISEMKRQLEKRKGLIENGKGKFELETVAISEREKWLKDEHVNVKQKIEQRASVKSQPKERPNLNPLKEKLRALKPELQHYEKEISKLNYHIDKQERDWAVIEESVMGEYKKQIQEFEEAIMSIEEQKMSIYAKLSEATHVHNQDLEQKAMLKEDLSSRLLQRANLVAQREEIEQAIETFRANNKIEMDFYFLEIQVKQQVASMEKEIQELYNKAQTLREQSGNAEGIKRQSVINEADLEQIVSGWRDLCSLEMRLNANAEEIGLAGFEGVYLEVLNRYGVDIEENGVWEYMQGIGQGNNREEIVEEIRQRMAIQQEGLEIWADQVAEQMREIGEREEEREFLRSYEEFCELIRNYETTLSEMETEKGEELSATGQANSELQIIQREIEEREAMKEDLEMSLNQRREEIENECLREAEIAFQAYVEQHASTFETLENEQGPEAAEEMKQQHHQEFIQLAQGSLQEHLDHVSELKEEVKRLEQTIQSNTDNVDLKILPLLQELLPTIEEGTVLISALKQQQLLLLETEDEVTGQLNYVLESRNDKLQQLHEKYTSSLQHDITELKEAKEMLEGRYRVLYEEAMRLENEIIEADKSVTEEILGERRLQKELKDIEAEFGHIEAIRKPQLHELDMQVGVWDKEIKEFEKILEHLEMQRLGLEQQYIEQNYLGDEVSYHSNTPVPGMHERPSRAQEYDSREIKSTDRYASNKGKDKENRNQMVKGFKNKGIQGMADIGGVPPGNFDLSPIGRGSHSPKGQYNKNKDILSDIHTASHPESSTGKDVVSNWTCFSPPNSAMLLGSTKRKYKASAGKEKSRERYDDGRKEETTYLKNYQKRLEQKQHALAHGQLPRSSTSVSLDTRTRSLPQTAMPNLGYNSISKQVEDAGFFTQHTSPKGNEALKRPPSGYQSAQSVQRNYFSKGLDDSGRMVLEDGTSMFSPKELSLNINSLKAQLNMPGSVMPQSMKSVPHEELRYKEFIGRNGELPGEDLAREFFEGEEHQGQTRYKKVLSVETSTHEGMMGRPSGQVAQSSGVRGENDMNVRRIHQNLHGMMGAIRREDGEDSNRSKSTGIHGGRVNARAGDYMSEKLSHREREERSQGRLDAFSGRNLGFMRSFGSPLRNFEHREGLHDSKGKTVANDHGLHEALFFETIKPLIQGSLVYKKFTSYQSLKRAEFDPLMGDLYPPEVCGYGVRTLKLSPSLDKIEVKHTAKASVELTIPVESILRPVVPQITMDILRVQKKIVESQHVSGHPMEDKISMADIFGDISTKALLAKRGVNSLNNGMERYLNCSYYSFSILLEKNGKVEFVTSRYNVFKEWIHGINMLLKHKKQLPKLKYKLDKM